MLRRLRLPIAEPCHENWDAMQGHGPRRFCDSCQTQVTNLSEMTEGEANDFLQAKAGKHVCVRYRRGPAGTVKFKARSVAAPAPTAMSGWRATLAAAGLAAMMLGGCTGDRSPDRIDDERCTYDMGPFSFELKRGEGDCPPAIDDTMVMGEMIAEPMIPDPVETMGKIAIEDPPPEPEVELMGDVAAPMPEPEVQGQAPIPCAGDAGIAPDEHPPRPKRL